MTGSRHSHLEEAIGVLGVPVMSKASFIHTERNIGEWWKGKLMESMLEAGREEQRLAEQAGSYHKGVLAITVDGGWSKRSHKHSYNDNSGLVIIVGKATGKLLHVGVRNKFCSACYSTRPTSLLQELECVILRNGDRCDCGRIYSGCCWGRTQFCLSFC